ncbi:hypothetical protein [Sporomusa carbonis]
MKRVQVYISKSLLLVLLILTMFPAITWARSAADHNARGMDMSVKE